MDAIKLLKRDHSTLKTLFNKFDRTGKTSFDKKSEIFDEMRRELQLHSRVEEEIFYPAIKAKNGEGRRLVSEVLRDHRQVDELLLQIARLKTSDNSFNEKMEALIENVEDHVEQEEGEIFQFVEENCSPQEIDQLGAEIERRKKILEHQLAA